MNHRLPENSLFPRYYNSSESSRAARIIPRHYPPDDSQRIVADTWLFVPERPRRKLAWGKPAPAGAAPVCAAKRTMPQRGIEEVFGGVLPAAFPPAVVAAGLFLRCPAGARRQAAPFPGATSAGADLLRLISSGIPPGREPRVLAGSAAIVRRSAETFGAPFSVHALPHPDT